MVSSGVGPSSCPASPPLPAWIGVTPFIRFGRLRGCTRLPIELVGRELVGRGARVPCVFALSWRFRVTDLPQGLSFCRRLLMVMLEGCTAVPLPVKSSDSGVPWGT
jgi:hypothetical protein